MTELLLAIITILSGAVAYFTKQIMDKTAAIESELKPMSPAIIEIQGKFTQAGYQLLFPLTVVPGSPLKITDFGKKLLNESGFYKVLGQNRAHFIELVKDRQPTSKYDIQQSSIEVVQTTIEKEFSIKAAQRSACEPHYQSADNP